MTTEQFSGVLAAVVTPFTADGSAVAVDGDLARGRELWAKINPICVFLESHSYAGAIKAGTALVGVDAGPTRSPILPLAEEFVDELRCLLRDAGVSVVG